MDPVNRLKEHYAEKELADTIAYVSYAVHRTDKNSDFTLLHRIQGRTISFILGFQGRDGGNYLVRFRIAVSLSDKAIARKCTNAVQAMRGLYISTRKKSANN